MQHWCRCRPHRVMISRTMALAPDTGNAAPWHPKQCQVLWYARGGERNMDHHWQRAWAITPKSNTTPISPQTLNVLSYPLKVRRDLDGKFVPELELMSVNVRSTTFDNPGRVVGTRGRKCAMSSLEASLPPCFRKMYLHGIDQGMRFKFTDRPGLGPHTTEGNV